MDKKMVNKMLEGATKQDFIEIISNMSVFSTDAEQIIIDWCKRNNEKNKMHAIEIELNNLWMKAREVISEFNAYGGGPDSDEDDAVDYLWRIESHVKKQKVSWDVRVRILDEMLEEFNIGNSGFDDLLIDIASSLCKTKEEKMYLADALAGGNNDYYRGYAADLYKSIGDNEKFLETKLHNMRYGSDYVDVAKYYIKRKDKQSALDYIWQGMEKSSGRLDELIDYAAPIYIKEENDMELRRMYQFVMETKWNINIVAMAKHLYQYAQRKGDYNSGKKMLLLILETCDKSEIKKWFEVCKRELSEKDWRQEYTTILEKIRKKDEKFYLDICMETGKESVVLESLQNARHGYDFWDLDYDGYFSKRLFKKYRNEVLALYWRDVNLLLSESKNKNYELAVKLLREIKSLMKKQGNEEKWRMEFGELKERNKRKRSFIGMLGNL